MADADLLVVDGLSVDIPTHGGAVQAVRDVSFGLGAGSTLALVGESGCGKSVTVQAIMGIVGVAGLRLSGSARFQGEDLLQLSEAKLNRLRGAKIGMVFQDPLSAFIPYRRRRVGRRTRQLPNRSQPRSTRKRGGPTSYSLLAIR